MIGLGIGFYSCGKKDDSTTSSSTTSNEAVGTLAITCGGVACVGTEGK